jgi:hypothetical protein
VPTADVDVSSSAPPPAPAPDPAVADRTAADAPAAAHPPLPSTASVFGPHAASNVSDGTHRFATHRGRRRSRAPQQAGDATGTTTLPRLPGFMSGTPAADPLLRSFARAWSLASRQSSAAHDLIATQSSVERSLGAQRARPTGGDRPDGSSAAQPPSQSELAVGTHGPRFPRGVGAAAAGGTGAPSSLMLTADFPRMSVNWLRSVTAVSIHLQFPETHRLERPG